MSNEKWNDSKIEETLTKLPPMKDKQSKDDLFQAIESRSKKEIPSRFSPKAKRPWILPAMAAAAAIFLMVLIIPPFFNGDQQFSTNDADQNSVMNTADVEENAADESAEPESESSLDGSDNDMNDGGSEDDENTEIANDENDEEQVSPEPSQLNQVIYIANSYVLDSNNTGDNFIVIEKQSSEDEQSLEEILMTSLQQSDPTSGQYLSDLDSVKTAESLVELHFSSASSLESLTSSEHEQLNQVFQEVLTLYGFAEVAFESGGETGIIFGQQGEVTSLPLATNNRGYYVISDEQDSYLISARMAEEEMASESGDPLNYAETVAKMAETEVSSDWYESAIPSFVDVSEVRLPGTTAEVYYTVSENEEIQNEEEQLETFFHALKLTASPFTLDNLQIINEETGEVVEVDLAE
ncbi:hypothetical protein [Salipaludibacillus daqingensis]|uniref:hypothetical protein n=1 Tax=Salipaludibacillus daqingensis TaxID=3041001 RepID=UPI002473A111|nr:hypothetical protein [Salipaludibacillus daqingensis]